MNTLPSIPISIGELFDKFSILEIKKIKIEDSDKLQYVDKELIYLKQFTDTYNIDNALYNQLKDINLKLWDIGDKIRIKENNNEFDNEFIQLARSVYFVNDERSEVKKNINILFNSSIFEVKSYVNYKTFSFEELSKKHTEAMNEEDADKSILLYNKLLDKIQFQTEKETPYYRKVIYDNIARRYYMRAQFANAADFYNLSIKAYTNIHNPTYINLGICLYKLKRFNEAEDYLKLVLSGDPGCTRANFAIGCNYMNQNKIKEGFKYFHKFCTKEDNFNHLNIWGGQKIGKLLVRVSGGFGDKFNFVRYIIPLSELYPDLMITFLIDKRLINLFKFATKNITIKETAILLDYDYHIRALAIPYLLNINKIVPPKQCYILENNNKYLEWKHIIEDKCQKKIKIALCWKGLVDTVEKYIPISLFKSISELDIDLISLQKYGGLENINNINFELHQFDFDNEASFVDTIAILKNIDLLITVDTAVAHLAGVLNINTWLIIGKQSAWLWFNDTELSQWYNTVKIFRSNEYNNWGNILDKVKAELKTTYKL